MNLLIENQINTSTGTPITGAYCLLDVNPNSLLSNLQVIYEPNFWINSSANSNQYDKIIPVLLNADNKISTRIGSFTVTLTPEQALAFNPIHAYEYARDYFIATYGWNVTIQN